MISELDRDGDCSADTESWPDLMASLAGKERASVPLAAGADGYHTAVHDAELNRVIARLGVPRSPEPATRPDPLRELRASSRLGTLARYGAAVAIAGLAALLVVAWMPDRNAATASRLAEVAPGSTDSTVQVPEGSARASPRLVFSEAVPGAPGAALPLGISLVNATSGDAVVLTGLPGGWTVTTGRQSGAAWYVYASELGDSAIRPARHFTGSADITVELLHGARTVDRRALHLEWAGAQPRHATPAAEAPPVTGAANRQLSAEELTALLARADDMAARGDLSAARLLLQRAAEAGDARAAAALSAVDDPSASAAKSPGTAAHAGLARDRIEDRDRPATPLPRRARLSGGAPRPPRVDVPRPVVGLSLVRSM